MRAIRLAGVGLMLCLSGSPLLSQDLRFARVFYVVEGGGESAMVLLRTEGARKIALLNELDVVIVREASDRVAHYESVLREGRLLDRVVSPADDGASQVLSSRDPGETRLLRFRGIDRGTAAIVLRSVYDMRKVDKPTEDDVLQVRAPAAKLDNAEALFRSLGVLLDA